MSGTRCDLIEVNGNIGAIEEIVVPSSCIGILL